LIGLIGPSKKEREKRDVPKWRLLNLQMLWFNHQPVIEFSTVLFFKQEINPVALLADDSFGYPPLMMAHQPTLP